MNVYVAHNFAARLWLRGEIVPILEANRHFVTSRWIKDDSHVEGTGLFCAVSDIEDIDRCSTFILFLKDHEGSRARGGKWFEFGYALRAGKRVIVIGEDKGNCCVFVNLPNVRWAKTIEEAVKLV
jgi:nucleoside 2-deoxyribosyltransferase